MISSVFRYCQFVVEVVEWKSKQEDFPLQYKNVIFYILPCLHAVSLFFYR